MRTRRDVVLAASFAALALAPHGAGAQQPAPPSAGPLGAVRGVVYDSLTHQPLAGATVQSVRAADLAWGRTAAADSAGAFRIDSLPPGRYFVGFSHPLLDLLRVEAMPRLVELGPGGDALRVDLGVPDLARVRPLVCGSAQETADSSGLVAGRVRDAADDAPVANAKVILTWSEVVLGTDGVRTEHRRVPVTTGPDGRYAICGVPADEELVATAEAPGRESGQVALVVPPRGLVVRDLTLGDTAFVATGVPSASPKRGRGRAKGADTTVVRVARGTARLTGTVRDAAGRPVRGGKAFVWGTAATTSVGGDGTFTLGELPEGTRTLEVRAIGFTMRRVAVDLAAGRAATVDVRMEPTAPTLNPVTVFGTPSKPSARVAEFLDRRRFGLFGRYITAEDIARRHDFDVTGSMRGMPGIQLSPNGRLGKTIMGRGPFGPCAALVILDGMPLERTDDIDMWVSPDQVAGIEIYADPAYAPPQYGMGKINFCSVVLVWTKG